ncbi:hypothetical protein NG895_26890 [Aeoliella sp. ICT_H6.2]|uniref:Uncharacterized protein n=1 Tax=Aeoliella straminimaris TaxID=2954799 RepID=A0A9X2JJF6_9BACT|nr:hypothetical protein [Aeoliella straminimaris]MCO6047547.1 hypothetical protein [Aeoliella straminimaris]
MGAENTSDFDPYYKWLGIPASDQPPNHYRLLGIELFEDDVEVITAAADRQMGHVKAFATGKYGAYSQLLLNELAKARVCLLNEKLKPIYDRQLKKLAAAEAAAAAPAPQPQPPSQATSAQQRATPAATSAVDESLETIAVVARHPRRKKRRSPLLLNLVLLLVVMPAVAWGAWKLFGTKASPEVSSLSSVSSELPLSAEKLGDKEKPARGGAGQDIAIQQSLDAGFEQATDPPTQAGTQRPTTGGGQPGGVGQAATSRPPFGSGSAFGSQPVRSNTTSSSSSPFNGLSTSRSTTSPSTASQPSTVRVQPTNRSVELARNDPRRTLSSLMRSRTPATMPTAVSLGDQLEAPVPICEYRELGGVPDLQLELLVPDFVTRTKSNLLLCQDPEADNAGRWLVFDESGPTARLIEEESKLDAAVPVGEFRAEDGTLSFAWLAGGEDQNKVDRLQHCVLRTNSAGRVNHVQLRMPVEDPEYVTIGDWREPHEVDVPLDSLPNCPPSSELRLRVFLSSDFPRTRTVTGDQQRLGEKEDLLLSFASADYAGFAVNWEMKGRILEFTSAPGFRLLALPNELQMLSAGQIDKAEKRLQGEKRSTERELQRRTRQHPQLTRNVTAARNLNITLPGGGTTVQLRNRKNAAIAEATAQVTANNNRINALREYLRLIDQDVKSRLPAIRRLARQIDGVAQVGYELYVPVGTQQLVIYRKGRPAAETALR